MAGPSITERGTPAWAQALPLALIFACFFIVPLLLTIAVSFWNYSAYEILPDITSRNYVEAFEGCASRLLALPPELCTTLKTYFITLRISLTACLIALVLPFALPP